MWAYTDDEIDYLGKRNPTATGMGAVVRPALSRFNPLFWLRLWLRREATRNELYQLDGQSLADLGITQGDFPAILDGSYRRGD